MVCHSGLSNPVQIVSTPPDYSFLGKLAAGWLEMLFIKTGDVETNPGQTTTRKQVWIGDICHRQIQVRKQISIKSNMIEHWVHLRCMLQTTQPTSGGAVTANSGCCANCVEPPRPQQWGPDLPFFGHAGHADPLHGWRCCSQKRVMSRPIQVRQL